MRKKHIKYTKKVPFNKKLCYFCWVTPASGWVRLNTDGTSKDNGLFASCGGALIDENGAWLRGISHYIGSASAYVA